MRVSLKLALSLLGAITDLGDLELVPDWSYLELFAQHGVGVYNGDSVISRKYGASGLAKPEPRNAKSSAWSTVHVSGTVFSSCWSLLWQQTTGTLSWRKHTWGSGLWHGHPNPGLGNFPGFLGRQRDGVL